MQLQYFIKKSAETQKIKDYKPYPETVKTRVKEIDGTDAYLVTFKISNNDQKAAKLLSEINDHVVKEYKDSYTTLENEASAYFNKTLYPFLNTFERLLRKVLYTAKATIKNNTEVSEKTKKQVETKIIDLEDLEFGPLFDILFTDESFNNSYKKDISSISYKITKQQLLDIINKKEEKILWKEFPNAMEYSPSLYKNFIKVREIRNDVMHAHNISYKYYTSAKSLLKKINKELTNLENKYIPSTEERIVELSKFFDQFNQSLNTSLEPYFQWQASLNKALEPITSYSSMLSNSFGGIQDAVLQSSQSIQNAVSGLRSPYLNIQEDLFGQNKFNQIMSYYNEQEKAREAIFSKIGKSPTEEMLKTIANKHRDEIKSINQPLGNKSDNENKE